MKVIFLKIKGYLLHSFILKMDCYVFEGKGGDHCLLFLLLTQNKNPALCSIVSIFLIKECMPSSFRCKLQYRDVWSLLLLESKFGIHFEDPEVKVVPIFQNMIKPIKISYIFWSFCYFLGLCKKYFNFFSNYYSIHLWHFPVILLCKSFYFGLPNK